MDTARKKYFIMMADPAAVFLAHAAAHFLLTPAAPFKISVIALSTAAKIATFAACHLYRFTYRYASPEEALKILIGNVIFLIAAMLPCLTINSATFGGAYRTFYVTEFFVSFFFLVAARYFLYFKKEFAYRMKPADLTKNAIIYGAGNSGEMVAWEMIRRKDLGYLPVGFIDDNPALHGLKIHGIEVVGGKEKLEKLIDDNNVEEIILAIPEAPGDVVRKIFEITSEKKVKLYTVPGLSEIIKPKPEFSDVRKFKVEDLLRRPQCQIDLEGISGIASGKTVLITGAGGSIGSEIAFQLLRFKPKRMLLMGRGENSIHETLNKLKFENVRETELIPIIADIKDRARIFSEFEKYKPDAVFHAAAHKHVYLMELYPEEAVINNVGGTMNLYDAAASVGTPYFTFISTDKAVSPSSVMGLTKRICEEFLLKFSSRKIKNCCIARFGNVLGSRGSVIHKFMAQIKAGGPVTVTHPDVTRFFMTVPEAAKLVLQASSFTDGYELFFLNMGESVKISDLARDMIKMFGKKPDVDVKIEYVGLLPGEKLHETLFEEKDFVVKTKNRDIIRINPERMYCGSFSDIEKMMKLALENKKDELSKLLNAMING